MKNHIQHPVWMMHACMIKDGPVYTCFWLMMIVKFVKGQTLGGKSKKIVV